MPWQCYGFPTGTHMANVFMCHFENIWLGNCPTQFKPVVYRRYVDGTILLLSSIEHVEKFKKYLNKQHKKLFIVISRYQKNRENNKFVTSFYRKLTFSGVFTNFESFISECYKRSLIDNLLYRGLSLTPIWKSFIRKLVLLIQSSKAMAILRNLSIPASKIFKISYSSKIN